MCMFMISFISVNAVTDLETDILGCWDFETDDGDEALDYYNIHNGSNINSPTVVSGKINNAYYFYGGQQVNIDDTTKDFSTFKNLTIAYWVNYTTLQGAVLDKGYTSSGCLSGGGCNPYRAGEMSAVAENFGSYSAGYVYGWKVITYKVFAFNKWSHVIMNWNNTHITLYVNNTQVGQNTFSGQIDANTQPLNFGAYWND